MNNYIKGAKVSKKPEPLSWAEITFCLLEFNLRNSRCMTKEEFLTEMGRAWDAFQKL